jgi:hypothetical protein
MLSVAGRWAADRIAAGPSVQNERAPWLHTPHQNQKTSLETPGVLKTGFAYE